MPGEGSDLRPDAACKAAHPALEHGAVAGHLRGAPGAAGRSAEGFHPRPRRAPCRPSVESAAGGAAGSGARQEQTAGAPAPIQTRGRHTAWHHSKGLVETENCATGFKAVAGRIGVCGIAFGGGAQPGGEIALAQAEGLGEQPLGLGRQALALWGQNQRTLRLLQLALRGEAVRLGVDPSGARGWYGFQ